MIVALCNGSVCGGRMIGDLRRRLDLKLTPGNYEQIMTDGILFAGTIEATTRPRHLKVVVYDYAADRVGTASIEIRRD
jgi:hypothetical protein